MTNETPKRMLKHAIGAWNRSTPRTMLKALDDLRYWANKCKEEQEKRQ